jgi:hypothetical protein
MPVRQVTPEKLHEFGGEASAQASAQTSAIQARARISKGNSIIAAVFLIFGCLVMLGWYLHRTPASWPEYQIVATRMTTIDYSSSMIWLNLAAWASFFAFWQRRYSLLAPGCILGGIGLGEVCRQTGMLMGADGIAAILGGLVIGLVTLYLVGKQRFAVSAHWPLYAAGVLALAAAGVLTASTMLHLSLWLIWIPGLLIGTGIYLGSRRNLTNDE